MPLKNIAIVQVQNEVHETFFFKIDIEIQKRLITKNS